MTRAMWKGVIRFEDVRVPVKLYAAVAERTIHFRLLHRKDRSPVRQAMVNADTDEVVPYEDTRRAFVTGEGNLVILRDEELEEIEPKASRDIEVLQVLPPDAIDHRWYLRPYYLGPDDRGVSSYAALTQALTQSGREGLARWVMRSREYLGALRVEGEHLMLMSLRHAEEVVSAAELQAPRGQAPARKELDMARQLVDMLTGEFDPTEYQDRYRARVEKLIDTKARGGRVRKKAPAKRRPVKDLTSALETSLKQERKRA